MTNFLNASMPRSGHHLASPEIPAPEAATEASDEGRREIFLHIGTEKTGSTAIQRIGNRERHQLRKDGVCYPTTPGEESHYYLALYGTGDTELRQMADLNADAAWQEFQKSFPEKLRTEIEMSGCRRVVLSSEHLSSRIYRRSQVQRLAELLQPVGRVKVVCYLRPQHELFLSANSTFIKAGGTYYRDPPADDADPFYNYEIMLGPWADVFGEANIILRVYDRERLKDNDIVSDFFSLLGCEICKSGAAEMRINRAFDPKTLEFLMLINQHVPVFKDHRWNPERAELTDALEAISSEPNPTLSVEELRRFFALFERSNAVIARRFLGRTDGILFANVSFVGRGETANLTVENAVEIAAHLWRWKSAHRQALPSSWESHDPMARKQNSTATEADIDEPTQERPASNAASAISVDECIAVAYAAVLERRPDPAAFQAYGKAFEGVSHKLGLERTLKALVRSDEFQSKQVYKALERVKQSKLDLGENTPNVLFLQTADPEKYRAMLNVTSKTVEKYCEKNQFQYQSHIGIIRGYHLWQATFNRIPLLYRLAENGFSGWVCYLDADAFIADLNFDIAGYLADKSDVALIAAKGGQRFWWDVNAGVLFLNFRHPLGQAIVREWNTAFRAITDDELRAGVGWSSVPDDQILLQQVLRAMPYAENHIVLDRTRPPLINYDGRFIKQILRVAGSLQERQDRLRAEVSRVLGMASPSAIDLTHLPAVS
jgi:hypothetical protein